MAKKTQSTKVTDEERAEFAPEVWVYIGRRYDAIERKLRHAFQAEFTGERGEPLLNPTVLQYDSSLDCHVVGGRYELSVRRKDDSTTVLTGRAKYLGSVKDEEQLRAIQSLSTAADVAHLSRKREEKDGRSKIAEMTLTELREAYRKAPPNIGRALLATAISIITRL
jgi:hypothetical protein